MSADEPQKNLCKSVKSVAQVLSYWFSMIFQYLLRFDPRHLDDPGPSVHLTLQMLPQFFWRTADGVCPLRHKLIDHRLHLQRLRRGLM